jgi:hypothetical protein
VTENTTETTDREELEGVDVSIDFVGVEGPHIQLKQVALGLNIAVLLEFSRASEGHMKIDAALSVPGTSRKQMLSETADMLKWVSREFAALAEEQPEVDPEDEDGNVLADLADDAEEEGE